MRGSQRGEHIWQAARTLLGVRFRLYGRDPVGGLDCVGLAGLALARAGMPLQAISDSYRLRDTGEGEAVMLLQQAGLMPVAAVDIGDILLLQIAPRQLHLAIAGQGDDGSAHMIHAHAGLGRVVEMPRGADPPLGIWRR